MGSVGVLSNLGGPYHSHARRGSSSIHRGNCSAEGCQRRQIMELDAWLGVRGQYLGGGVGGQAVRCHKGQVPMVLAEVGF